MILSILPMENSDPIEYTTDHNDMTPGEMWAAWKTSQVTIFHVLQYQTYKRGYFTKDGEFIKCI